MQKPADIMAGNQSIGDKRVLGMPRSTSLLKNGENNRGDQSTCLSENGTFTTRRSFIQARKAFECVH